METDMNLLQSWIEEIYDTIPYNNLLSMEDQSRDNDDERGGNCEFLCNLFVRLLNEKDMNHSFRMYYAIKDGDAKIENLSSINHIILFDPSRKFLIEMAGHDPRIVQLKNDQYQGTDKYGSSFNIILNQNFIYHFRNQKEKVNLVNLVQINKPYKDDNSNQGTFLQNVVEYKKKYFTIRSREGPPYFAVRFYRKNGRLMFQTGFSSISKRKEQFLIPRYTAEELVEDNNIAMNKLKNAFYGRAVKIQNDKKDTLWNKVISVELFRYLQHEMNANMQAVGDHVQSQVAALTEIDDHL